ncbi:MAG: hypothetical protein WA064_02940 [Candidatus Moraniibacteriota bacterium]
MLENKAKIFEGKSLNNLIKLFFGAQYLKSRIVLVLLSVSALINLLDWLALIIFLRPPAGTVIILHYNVYFGVDLAGKVLRAYAVPFIGLCILGINFFLAGYFYRQKERIASYVLLISALIVQLSLLISIISVIVVNY